MTDEQHLKALLRGISHDLRGSLGASATFADMLIKHYGSKLDARAHGWLKLMASEYALTQKKLVGLSAYAHLFDMPEPQYSLVALSELLEKARAKSTQYLNKEGHNARQIMLNCQSLPSIVTNGNLLIDLLSELLTNSILHADCSKPPLCSKDGHDADTNIDSAALIGNLRYQCINNQHCLTYQDNGQAVSDTNLAYLQQPLKTIKQHQRAQQSAGLGVSRMKRIAELLNAELRFDNTAGAYAGLSAILTLPM